MSFAAFAEHMKGAATMQVSLIRGDLDVVPMLHFYREGRVESIVVDEAWMDPSERERFVHMAVLPFMGVFRPEYVGWTFSGRRGTTEGEFDHETAVALCIERERHETWLARLVRHDDMASLGAWRSWPPNQQEGPMLQLIQESLR